MFEVEKFGELKTLDYDKQRVENSVAQHGWLKALRDVMPAKMELLCDGWKFVENDLRASSVSYSRTSSAGSD